MRAYNLIKSWESRPARFSWSDKGMAVPLKYTDINVVYEIHPFCDAEGDGNV